MSVITPSDAPPTASVEPGRTDGRRLSLRVQMGVQVGRSTGFYTLIIGSIFPIALFNTAVLTRYLSTSQFGKLSVLYFAAALDSIILGLVALRGTERAVWGTTDEGVDVDQEHLVDASQRPRVLATGITISLIVAALSIAATVPFAGQISSWLVGTPKLANAVVWTSVSGALGSVWRLAVNIPRWERRQILFGTTWVSRQLIAVCFAWPLVAAGLGVSGALAGTVIGTTISIFICLIGSRRSYSFGFDWDAAKRIVLVSRDFAAMVVGLYILHSGDVFFLSRFVDSSKVGVFRLATNITSIISYWVSSFLMAWAPLEYSPLFRAAYDRHGRDATRMKFLTYFVIIGVFFVLLLAALATPLVGIFAASYRNAAAYVAVTGVAYLSYGGFLVTARSALFPRRYFFYGVAAIVAAFGLGLTSWLLGPSIGGYGVAIGDIVGALAGTSVILIVAAIAGETPPADLKEIVLVLTSGGVCFLIGDVLGPLAGSFDVPLRVVSFIVFPALLIFTGIIPKSHRRQLWAIIRTAVRFRSRSEDLIPRLAELPTLERRVLLTIARDHKPPARVTALTGLSESRVLGLLVSGLRRLAGAGEASADDLAIGHYLVLDTSPTERGGVERALWDKGVPPLELYQIGAAFRALHDAPPRDWAVTVVDEGRELPPAPWSLSRETLELAEEAFRNRRSRAELARSREVDERELDRRLVGALRTLGIGGESRPTDSLIAAFLLDWPNGPPTRQLWAAGVDPLELHQLSLTLEAIRSLPSDRWLEIVAG